MPSGNRHRDRTRDVKRRANVRIRVEIIEIAHKAGQKITSAELTEVGTKLLHRREDEVYDHCNGIRSNDEVHILLIRLGIEEDRINVHSDYVSKPYHIRDDKKLAERNHVVKRRIYNEMLAVFDGSIHFK